MTLHTDRRWLTVCLGIFLGVLSVNAAAIDPGTVEGQLTQGGKVYTLKHVYAWQQPGQAKEMWIYVTDVELPAAAAMHRFKPEELAREGRLRGVKLVINPTRPDLELIDGVRYEPNSLAWSFSGRDWQRLLVADKRVVGKLQYADNLGSDPWSLDVEFSAPVSGSGTLEHIAFLFQDTPAALVAFLCVALIAPAIWLARKSLAHYRIIQAIRTAPTVKTNSDARGLVKVVGEAQSGRVVPGGKAKPKDVWSRSATIQHRSSLSASSHYLSVEPILVQDATGGLIVDPRQAVIVPGTIEGTMHSDLDSEKPHRTRWSIRTGAPVFAIGIIHRGKHKPGETPSHGVLGKSDHGVLLLSAKTESRTLTRFHLRLWPMAVAAALCAWHGALLTVAVALPWMLEFR